MTGDCHLWEEKFSPSESFLIFGNEADGVSSLDAAKKVYIPMPGASESLNVAMAASILCFEAVRRQNI